VRRAMWGWGWQEPAPRPGRRVSRALRPVTLKNKHSHTHWCGIGEGREELAGRRRSAL
jgi:hypothetical protein